ncbi:histidine kinase [Arthrobacter sp. 260]|uniref:histidine kinase n=1 Tax=Arthrobacter sp. 260 TaxID=2735314 RepID=UPI0014927CB1|nr:hypothetical protein [Arthrobacter sp. 260]
MLLVSLFVLEQRHFDSSSALLLALLFAVAAAELVPAAAMIFVLIALGLQATGIMPPVILSGVSSYVAVPVVIFFATLVWKSGPRWVTPVAAVVYAALITVIWFQDSSWITYVFGEQLYDRALIQTAVYAFLILGAFAAFHLTGWALGAAVSAASASSRAQAQAEEKLRETEIELLLEQERNRIARDLHDVLAHSLAVIIAQAEGIRYIHRLEPEAVEESATVIADSARRALVDTRRLLEGVSPTGPTEERDPDDRKIADLIRRFTSSGMPVAIQSTGTPWEMSVDLELTVYRLTQESLTNAFKHGDREAGATLTTRWTADGMELAVSSSFRPSEHHRRHFETYSSGRGITGMRDRAEAVGGWLEVSIANGVFEVTAFIPSPHGIDHHALRLDPQPALVEGVRL